MPILSSCILAQASTLLVCLGLVPAVVVTSAPTNADVYAVLGAFFATALAGLRSLGQHNTLNTTSSILLASAGIGSMGPGLTFSILANVLPGEWQKWIPNMSWHVWASMGLVYGLCGWGIVLGVMNFSRKSLPDIVEQQMNERMPRVKKPGGGSMHIIAMLIIPCCLVCCTTTTRTTQTLPDGKQTVTVVTKEPSPALMPLLAGLVEPGYGAVVGIGSKLVGYVAGWMSSKPKTPSSTPATP